jgi:hypothetical protein
MEAYETTLASSVPIALSDYRPYTNNRTHTDQCREFCSAPERAGISYIWGKRTKYTGYLPNEYDYRKIGMLAEAGYNYNFCHHRLNIGLSETMKAHNGVPVILYTNLNIGYNFNWKNKKSAPAKG